MKRQCGLHSVTLVDHVSKYVSWCFNRKRWFYGTYLFSANVHVNYKCPIFKSVIN